MILEARASIGAQDTSPKRLLVGEPRGLCAGVLRSLQAFDEAISQNPIADIYSVGQPAHNTHINKSYVEKGILFVNRVSDVPIGGIVLLGPHGTERDEVLKAKERQLQVKDTICPLVVKVEDEIGEYTRQGIVTVYWGDRKHQEAKSALSAGDVILVESLDEALSDEVAQKIKDKNGVAFASQTTFNVDEAIAMEEALKEKYPNLITPKTPDRCYATRNRQAAVKKMIEDGATFIVIVGSSTSSNSLRLYEVALENGAEAVFVDSAKDLDAEILSGHTVIGFESGASVEEDKFQEVVEKVKLRYSLETEIVSVADESRIHFASVKTNDYRPQIIWESQAIT